MVILLLDFEKVYHIVKWDFLEGTMHAMGFDPTWIKSTRALYIDSWCAVGLNGTTNETFKFSRSIRQGCPLAPFLFLANCLGHVLENVLENDPLVEGISLPNSRELLIDCEFANKINLYLVGNLQNLINVKVALSLFSLAFGAQINWDKSSLFGSPISLDLLTRPWGQPQMDKAMRDDQIFRLYDRFPSL